MDHFIAPPAKIGRSRRIDDASGRYIVHVKNTFPLEYTLDGFRLVLDSAHGACYKVAPIIFRELGCRGFCDRQQPQRLQYQQAGRRPTCRKNAKSRTKAQSRCWHLV